MAKPPKDMNQFGHFIVAKVTGQLEKPIKIVTKSANKALAGKKGGLIGGKVRAKKLTKTQRSAIASKAAKARWKKS